MIWTMHVRPHILILNLAFMHKKAVNVMQSKGQKILNLFGHILLLNDKILKYFYGSQVIFKSIESKS